MIEAVRRNVEQAIPPGFTVEEPLITKEWSPEMPFVALVDSFSLDDLTPIDTAGLKVTPIKQIPGKMLLHDRRFTINDEVSWHQGSQFGYLGEMKWNENDTAYLSYGEPNSATSQPHWHLFPEYYRKLYGKAKIRHHEGDEGYDLPEYFKVKPGVRHQIITEDSGVLLLLMTKESDNLHPDIKHIR